MKKIFPFKNSSLCLLIAALFLMVSCRKEIDNTYTLNISTTTEIAPSVMLTQGSLGKNPLSADISSFGKQQGFSVNKIKNAHVKHAELVLTTTPLIQGYEAFDYLEIWLIDPATKLETKVAYQQTNGLFGKTSTFLDVTNDEISELINKKDIFVELRGKSNQVISQKITIKINLAVEFDAILFN